MRVEARVEARLFGTPELLRSGDVVSIDTRKAIAMLAYLSATGTTVSRDRLGQVLRAL